MDWERAEELINKIGCCVAKYEEEHCNAENCGTCPYYVDRNIFSVEDEVTAYTMASEAMHLRTVRQAVMRITVNCPTCGKELDLTQGNKICPHCGQWLDYDKERFNKSDVDIVFKGEKT